MRRGQEPAWLGLAKWVGTAAGIAGAMLVALNLGVVGYGFALFLVSSVLWTIVGCAHREASLVLLQAAFTAINLIGIWRW